jgi:hypothetical protein
MKKQDVIKLWNTLNALKRIKSTRFAYFVAKNLGNIKTEIDALSEVQKPDEKMKEYEQKRMDLIKKYGTKGADGALVEIAPGQFKLADIDGFTSSLKMLDGEYQETLEDQLKKNKEFEELIKETVSLEMYKFKFDDLPDGIDGTEMEVIMPLITSLP